MGSLQSDHPEDVRRGWRWWYARWRYAGHGRHGRCGCTTTEQRWRCGPNHRGGGLKIFSCRTSLRGSCMRGEREREKPSELQIQIFLELSTMQMNGCVCLSRSPPPPSLSLSLSLCLRGRRRQKKIEVEEEVLYYTNHVLFP